MTTLQDMNAFNVADSELYLWVFKKSQSKTGKPVYTGRWIPISDGLKGELKQTVLSERARIKEVIAYSLLAQNNEVSALEIGTDETHASLLIEAASDPTDKKKVLKIKDLLNTTFYAIKLIHAGKALYAVKKADASWLTRKQKGLLNVVFSDETLTIDEETRFSISKSVDFFVLDDAILVSRKDNFESVLNHKKEHIEDFGALKSEVAFVAIFSELGPIETYVADNKIQLRRASAIKSKGHYKDANFMQRLKDKHKQFKLDLTFDKDGKLVPTADNCRHIFQALLDHRLESGFSENIYDVQDTSNVA